MSARIEVRNQYASSLAHIDGKPTTLRYADHKGRDLYREIDMNSFERGPLDAAGNPPDNFDGLTAEEKKDAWRTHLETLSKKANKSIDQINTLRFHAGDTVEPGRDLTQDQANLHASELARDFVQAGKDLPREQARDLLRKAKIVTVPKKKTWFTVGMFATLATCLSIFLAVKFLPKKKSTRAPDKPGTPTATQIIRNEVEVTWPTPAADGPEIDNYTVEINGTAHTVSQAPTVSTVQSHVFKNVTDGTYTVNVTASNSVGDSPTATSDAVIVKAENAPDDVVDLEAIASQGGNGLQIIWNEPTTGDKPTHYKVKVAKVNVNPVEIVANDIVVLKPGFSIGELEPGTYEATVFASNSGGDSAGLVTGMTVIVDAGEDAPIGWGPLITDEILRYWENFFDRHNDPKNVDPYNFFEDAVSAISEPELDANGKQISAWQSYESQRVLARFLYLLSADGKDDIAEINAAAKILVKNTAGFPTGKYTTANPDDLDPKPLWKTATQLGGTTKFSNPATSRAIVCAALDQVIKTYLGDNV